MSTTVLAAPGTERILVIDDDQTLLDSIVRAHRRHLDVHTALGARNGLEALRTAGPFAAVFCDYRMPHMNGAECLAQAREIAPDTVRVMLTGNADQATAVDAINRGQIFRFLSKPCDTAMFAACARDAIQTHHRLRGERDVLERTVRGGVQMLCDVMALTSPEIFGRVQRVRDVALQLGTLCNYPDAWELESAALLSMIGMVAVPHDVVTAVARGKDVGVRERAILKRHVNVGSDLIRTIPRLEGIARIVLYQGKRMDGGGLPTDDVSGERIPLGARILLVATDFQDLVQKGMDKETALAELDSRRAWYDPSVLRAARELKMPATDMRAQKIPIARVVVGQILNQDIVNSSGSLVVSKGQAVTESMAARLRSYAELGTIPEQIEVLSV